MRFIDSKKNMKFTELKKIHMTNKLIDSVF